MDLGTAPEIGLAGVSRGIVPDPQWKLSRYGQPWAQGETLITAIGQGFMLTSPLQMAVMTARIASGRSVSPRLYLDQPVDRGQPLAVDGDHMDLIRDGLRAVVHEPGGTSYYTLGGLGVDGVEMAGKTGTAQVYSITQEEREAGVRSQDELPWRLRDHGMFVCYAPADRPRYAVATVVEHGGGGSRAAARPARDILRLLIERDPAAAGPFVSLDSGSGARPDGRLPRNRPAHLPGEAVRAELERCSTPPSARHGWCGDALFGGRRAVESLGQPASGAFQHWHGGHAVGCAIPAPLLDGHGLSRSISAR